MAKPFSAGKSEASASLAEVQAQLITSVKDKARARRLLAKHHYLGDVRAVGEQLFYAILGGRGDWLGVMVLCAASRRLRARDRWIGWSEEQRRRRLPLVVNNCRFLLLPDKTFPNLGSRSLRMVLDRLSADWQQSYGHPVVLVETFVDPEQFCGTVYTANGWQALGQTPMALAVCAAIFTWSIINPSVALPANSAATPAAICKPANSNPR